MTDELKKIEEKEEKAVAPALVQVELEEEDDDEPMTRNDSSDQPEDLPEDVKKKLEKTKAEKVNNKSKKRKKASDKKVATGKAYIHSTYNNTIITLADTSGNVIAWASAGVAGFKGPKKSTPYAASIITRIAVDKAKERGLKEVYVFVKGVGTGREAAVRALNSNGLIVTGIKDVTPMPHNGCRPKKPRRV